MNMLGKVLKIFAVFTVGIVIKTSASDEGCGYPGLPVYGRFVEGNLKLNSEFPTGFVITYECQEPFKLVGNPQRTCECTGRWSGSIPECVDEDNELVNPSPDYYVIDSETSSMEPEEIWKTISFPVSCEIPDIPNEGKLVVIKGKNGAVHVVYECKSGYYLVGESTITCKDGMWSENPPRCLFIEIDQSGVHHVKHSNVDDVGPALSGSSSSVIGMNGKDLTNIELAIVGDTAPLRDLLISITFILSCILLLLIVGFIKFSCYFQGRNNSSSVTRPGEEEANPLNV